MIERFFPRPSVEARGVCWTFECSDPNFPRWLNGFRWPIDQEGAQALVGMYVNIRFDWKWETTTNEILETKVTITDSRSDLEVHERTFPLAADAFIVAAKRMRLER